MSDLDELYVHEVNVEPYTGVGSAGRIYGPAVTVPCFVDDSRRLVRDSEGAQVVSESTVYAAPSYADTLAPMSRVTWQGDVRHVLVTKRHTSGALELPDHVEAALT